jgi:threonine dehydratase
MIAITFGDVQAARARIAGAANRTPVLTSRTLNGLSGREVFLKCESFQRGGAFKFRGAYNKISLLGERERRRGILAFSSGNHAQGVALAARLLGVRATIVVPADAPRVKIEATREYGAQIVHYDRQREDREEIGRGLAEERGLTLVPPYDDPAIMAGAGTAALELLEEVPALDALITPVSGGGLLSGSAVAARGLSPRIRIFGVEPANARDTWLSLEQGERVEIPPPATIADGLRVTIPGRLTFPVLRELVEAILLVSEEAILDAVRFLLLRMKIVVEPSGAVPVAALLTREVPQECRRVGLIVSGGNIDPALLAALCQGQRDAVGILAPGTSRMPECAPAVPAAGTH